MILKSLWRNYHQSDTENIQSYLADRANLWQGAARLSSRRRRNFFLRFGYVALLTLFIILFWFSVADSGNAAMTAFSSSRMSEVGLAIIGTIVLFQFFATQLIAVIMLSTAISDEIFHKTLGVLMTTPINSLQIVVGKLFSKLLQLLILMAVSLPLLAVVRVFGGVPWGFIISGLSVTLTAVIFAGTLSLFCSISGRKSYAVIIKTLFLLGVFYAAIPVFVGLLLEDKIPKNILFSAFLYTNPVGNMFYMSRTMLTQAGMAGMFPISFYWQLHCLVMLGMSGLLIAWSVAVVRRVALSQAVGQSDPTAKRKERKRKEETIPEKIIHKLETTGQIRRIYGSPIVWKELRTPFIQGGRKLGMIGAAVAVAALVFTYLVCLKEDCLDEDFIHMAYVLIFMFIGLIANIVFSAGTITSEKESRSWPILMATPMNDWSILLGKLIGNIRRCLPIWLFLVGHVLLFALLRYIHPAAIILLAILLTTTILFISCTGLYFSARFHRTGSAVVANFALALFLWLILPMLMGLVTEIARNQKYVNITIEPNPVFLTAKIMEATSGAGKASKPLKEIRFKTLPYRERYDLASFAMSLTKIMIVYLAVGGFLLWRAKCLFRKRIF